MATLSSSWSGRFLKIYHMKIARNDDDGCMELYILSCSLLPLHNLVR
jgi:hypothetical protein